MKITITARFVGGVLDGQEHDLPLGRRFIVPARQMYERRQRTDWTLPDGLIGPDDPRRYENRYEMVLVSTEPPERGDRTDE